MYMKNCETCGKPFRAKQSKTRPEKKYCGRPCYGHAKAELPITLTCKTCGKEFQKGSGVAREYRKKFGHDQQYCSIPCSAIGRKADTDASVTFTCVQCGGTFPSPRKPSGLINRHRTLCSTECRSKFRSERANRGSPDVTRQTKKNGYVWLSVPIHLSGTGKRERVQEHRKVMEDILGRPLVEGEEIHHLNGQRGDNRPANLQLWSTRQPKGQLIPDKIAFAIEMMQLYPSFAREAGYELRAVAPEDHVTPPVGPR